SAFGLRIVSAMQFGDRTGLRVFRRAHTLDDVSIAEPDLPSGRKTIELFRWVFPEIILLDVQRSREGNLSRSRGDVLRIIHGVEFFNDIFRIIVEYDFQRSKHGHHTR